MSRALHTSAAAIMVGMSLVALATPASAATMVYTFDAPQFTLDSTTPLLARAPNVGDPTFLTDFTSSPNADGFLVGIFTPNPLFSGAALIEPIGADETLTLAFSSPIFALQVDFAVNTPNAFPGALQLITPVGSTTQAAANLGGAFPGGTLIFESLLPFSTVQLLGFGSGTTRADFAIDDLTLNTTSAIPEPTSMILLGTGLAGLIVRRYGRKRS